MLHPQKLQPKTFRSDGKQTSKTTKEQQDLVQPLRQWIDTGIHEGLAK
jgi:hypothetical protein